MSVQIFGIRHHGPGCARSLRSALQALKPDVVLIEGPPDAASVLPLLAQEDMKPPVALLIYPSDEPQRAVFFPFAAFSPEWQALRYAFDKHIPARFIDLPQAHRLAMEPEKEGLAEANAEHPPLYLPPTLGGDKEGGDAARKTPTEATLEDDPLGSLALAAGYRDRELWWEHQIEQRQDPTGLFEGIMEAMTALRAKASSSRPFEAQREAFMRQSIRAAQKDGFKQIAVICGAWHAPRLLVPKLELENEDAAGDDGEILKGLPKTKVQATWVPWTYSRLSYRSGYGAGITSPGWYDHLWHFSDRAALRWSTHVARLLRQEGLDASSASVIETVRLGEALAALRHLPMPGLAELNEAVLTVLCAGDSTPMRLIHDRLEVGDRLGKVPANTPAVPLQRDLESKQKQLRLKPTTEIKNLDLDLRNDTDRSRSRLLHQLRLLGIGWGEPLKTSGKAGTFHELWRLQWQVEFVVNLIEASVWGNTIEHAASASGRDRADKAPDLPTLTELLDGVVIADLPQAIEHTLSRLQAQAAVAADVRHLMDALPALTRVARYGDVRGTRTEYILPIINGLFERIIVGLPGACSSLDDEAAGRIVVSIGNVQQSLDLLDNALSGERVNPQAAAMAKVPTLAVSRAEEWQQVLLRLLDNDSIHGLVRGWCCRLLLEKGALCGERVNPQAAAPAKGPTLAGSRAEEKELHRRARLALSSAVPVLQAAAWIEGLLRGSGLVLLHQDALWLALDLWLGDIGAETFVELLPGLRRAFAGFQPPERRAMADKVKKLGKETQNRKTLGADSSLSYKIHRDRADLVLPILAHVLGVKWENRSRGENKGET